MKKLVIVLLMFVGLLLLSACGIEAMKSPKGWALHYAIEYYGYDYKGYELGGYIIEEYTNTFVDDDFDGNYKMYRITFINEFGGNIIYNVIVSYELSAFDKYFGKRHFKESQITDYDVEQVICYE